MRKRRKQLPHYTDALTVHSLSHEGRGVAHIDGKTTFIHGALPGETVNVEFTYANRSYNEANATDVLSSSPHRSTPKCAHYSSCGGCQLQHMDMRLQLEHKEKVLLEQFKHFGQVTPKAMLSPLSGKQWQYRHKARLGVRFVEKKDGRILVGFRERNGRFLADMQQCDILHPAVGEKLSDLSQLIQRLQNYRHIPQIEVAVGNQQVALVIRHMTAFTQEDLAQLRSFSETYNMDIYSHPNSPEPIRKLFPNDGYERLKYSLPNQQLDILFHPTDFTQINEEMNPQMINRALELLNPKPHETILDLFCGIGNFTLAIARYAKHVVGIEGADSAVQRARENAAHNKINNVEFHTADLSKDCTQMPWCQRHYDKILLDPSRAGADAILKILPTLQAHTIVYVSCNPATLSRDAGILVNELGYSLESAGIINMFPHTAHVESIALFKKGENHVV